jgi:PAS domain S-box-containing protein
VIFVNLILTLAITKGLLSSLLSTEMNPTHDYAAYPIIVALILALISLTIALRLLRQVRNRTFQMRQTAVYGQENEKLYAEMVEHASDVIFRLDHDGRIVAMNRSGQQLLGYSLNDLTGKRITDLVPPEQVSGLSQIDGSQEYGAGEVVLLNAQQQPVYLELSLRRERVDGQTRSIEIIARNITERRRLEVQHRQTERMQAMGLLAGGVAHDFNNYLTVILNFAELALETQLDPDVRNMIQEIRQASQTAADMSRQMLDFSRHQPHTFRPINLNQVITNLQAMLQSGMGKKIELKLELTAGIPKVVADLGSVEQMLLNLALNARDAMPEGGKLTIRTFSPNEKRVILELADTGIGMDKETQSRLFEPFFTTKEAGKGTGLGLATVHRIVMKSGAKIVVESELKKGTTFRIDFPAYQATKISS